MQVPLPTKNQLFYVFEALNGQIQARINKPIDPTMLRSSTEILAATHLMPWAGSGVCPPKIDLTLLSVNPKIVSFGMMSQSSL